MKHFVSMKKYNDLKLDSDCRIQCLAKQNEGLWDRLHEIEDYRNGLELENASLRDANRRLVYEKDETDAECNRMRHRLRELELMLGSMEAQWRQRTGAEV